MQEESSQQKPYQSDDRKWGLICYIPVINLITCAVTAVVKVKSKFALFHARQGIVLFVLWFITILVAFVSPVLSLMMWGAVLLLHAAGMVIAYGGKTTKIPVLGDFALKIPETYFFTLLTQKTLDEEDKPAVGQQQPDQPRTVPPAEGSAKKEQDADPPPTDQ